MQAPPPQASLKAATGMLVGPVKVESLGVVKFTWNFQRLSELVPKLRKKLGLPVGGGLAGPSRSEGNKPPKLELSWKHCSVAACPASIAVRSRAHARPPTKVFPENMLNEM